MLRELIDALLCKTPVSGDPDYFKHRDQEYELRYSDRSELHRAFHPPFDQEEEEWVVDRRK